VFRVCADARQIRSRPELDVDQVLKAQVLELIAVLTTRSK